MQRVFQCAVQTLRYYHEQQNPIEELKTPAKWFKHDYFQLFLSSHVYMFDVVANWLRSVNIKPVFSIS